MLVVKAELVRTESTLEFVVHEVPDECRDALADLGFEGRGDLFRRSFPADASGVEAAYAGFTRHLDELVLQAARQSPAPWEAALERLLDRIGGEHVDWWLTGSGALAVRGIDVAPRDLDVVVDEVGARRLAELLADELVEPFVRADWFCRWWGRAFLGARVEWAGGVGPRADEPLPTDFGLVAAAALEEVAWRGHVIRVPPLALQLDVSERRGLNERAREIRALLES